MGFGRRDVLPELRIPTPHRLGSNYRAALSIYRPNDSSLSELDHHAGIGRERDVKRAALADRDDLRRRTVSLGGSRWAGYRVSTGVTSRKGDFLTNEIF